MTERYKVEVYGTSHGGQCGQCSAVWSVLIVDERHHNQEWGTEGKVTIAVLCDSCAARLAVALLEAAGR